MWGWNRWLKVFHYHDLGKRKIAGSLGGVRAGGAEGYDGPPGPSPAFGR